jgi:hypothetical protein
VVAFACFMGLTVRGQDFAGGHIRGCLNVPSENFYQDEDVDAFIKEHLKDKTLVVVHCMLSRQRGPFCARRWFQPAPNISLHAFQPSTTTMVWAASALCHGKFAKAPQHTDVGTTTV